MGLLLLIPGLVLWLTNGWFSQQHTVGAILAIAGGVILTAQILWLVFIAAQAKKGFDRF